MNKKEFESLFKEYYQVLTAFALPKIKDLDASKSIVHEVFINLWNKKDEMDPHKSIKSYLFQSVKNRCLNHIRDYKKFANAELLEIQFSHSGSLWEQQEKMQVDELQAKIDLLIDGLPEKCKEVFLLSRYQGMPYKQIAEQLDISIKTVENQMGKALKTLKIGLKDYIQLFILILFNL